MTTLIVRSSHNFNDELGGESFAILPTDKLDTEIFNFGEILTTLDIDLDNLFLFGHIYQSDCHTPRINDKNELKLLKQQEHLGAQECPEIIDENAVRSKNTPRIMQTDELDFSGKPSFSDMPKIISEYRDLIKKYEKEILSFYLYPEKDFHKDLYKMLYEKSSNGTLNNFNCLDYGFGKESMGLIKSLFQHVIKFETPYFEFKLLKNLQAQNVVGHVFIPADMSPSEKNKIKLNNPEINITEYKNKEDVINSLRKGGQKHTKKQQDEIKTIRQAGLHTK